MKTFFANELLTSFVEQEKIDNLRLNLNAANLVFETFIKVYQSLDDLID